MSTREVDGADRQHPAVDFLEVDKTVVSVYRLHDMQRAAVVGDVLHAVDQHQIDQQTELRRHLRQCFLLERDCQVLHLSERLQDEVFQRAEVLQRSVVDVDVGLAEVYLGEILFDEVLKVACRLVWALVRRPGFRQRVGRSVEGVVDETLETVHPGITAEIQCGCVAQGLDARDRFHVDAGRFDVLGFVKVADLLGVGHDVQN